MFGQSHDAADANGIGTNYDVARADSMARANGWRTTSSGTCQAAPSGLRLTFRDGQPVGVENSRRRRLQLAGKRAIDAVLSLSALVFFAPFLALVAVTIVLTSKGPVFFKQMREGLNGEPFEVYKFRSMRIDQCDVTGVAQTKAGDPRLTPIGRFLRQTSIDELPQLFNVLKGDMSLIGPRPHVYDMLAGGRPYRELVPYYTARHAMKPGISGWAQANGLRGPTDEAALAWARIDHDLAYIQNFSLLLDLRIIWLTVHREFIGGTGI